MSNDAARKAIRDFPHLAGMSVSELLTEALKVGEKLEASIDNLFPRGASEVNAGTAPSLAELTFDEKMALGDKAAADLTKLAYRISPSTVLDGMEEKLATDDSSRMQATALMEKLNGH